jgi:hypothetical protein
MDISSASSVSTFSGQSIGNSVENEVMRKAQQVQEQSAAARSDSAEPATKAASANMPSHLGQNVNTTA